MNRTPHFYFIGTPYQKTDNDNGLQTVMVPCYVIGPFSEYTSEFNFRQPPVSMLDYTPDQLIDFVKSKYKDFTDMVFLGMFSDIVNYKHGIIAFELNCNDNAFVLDYDRDKFAKANKLNPDFVHEHTSHYPGSTVKRFYWCYPR